MADETTPVLDGSIALFFLFASYAVMYYSGYISGVIDAFFRPHSRVRSRSLLALPVHFDSHTSSQLTPLPRSQRFPLATRLAVLPPPAIDMRFLVQVPLFQNPLDAPNGPTALAVYSRYKPPTTPPVRSNVPDVSMGLQGANYYLMFQTMAATPFLYLSPHASTTPVFSSLISASSHEEGSLALLITLASILFIALLFWAFNGRRSDGNGKIESFGLSRKRGDNSLFHAERRDLLYLDEEWYLHLNGLSGHSFSQIFMTSSPVKSCIASDNTHNLHIAPHKNQNVFKEYDARKRNMVLKRLSEFQEVISGLIVAMSRRGKLREENSLEAIKFLEYDARKRNMVLKRLSEFQEVMSGPIIAMSKRGLLGEENGLHAIKILVELHNYTIPTSMGIEAQSGLITTTRNRLPRLITGMEIEINYERWLRTILSPKVQSLIFKIEDLVTCFKSYKVWNVSLNGRHELLIGVMVDRFHQMVLLINLPKNTFAISMPMQLEVEATAGFDSRMRAEKSLSICAPISYNHYMNSTISFMVKAFVRSLGESVPYLAIPSKPKILGRAQTMADKRLVSPALSGPSYMVPFVSYIAKKRSTCTRNHREIDWDPSIPTKPAVCSLWERSPTPAKQLMLRADRNLCRTSMVFDKRVANPSFSDPYKYMAPTLFVKKKVRTCTSSHGEFTSYQIEDGILQRANERPTSSVSQSRQIWKPGNDEGHDELPIDIRAGRFPHSLNSNTIILNSKVKANKITSPILYAHYMKPTISSQAKVRASKDSILRGNIPPPTKPTMSRHERPSRKILNRADPTLIHPTFSRPNFMALTVSAKAKVRTCAVGKEKTSFYGSC